MQEYHNNHLSNSSLAMANDLNYISSGVGTDLSNLSSGVCNRSGFIPPATPRHLVREGGPIIIAIYVFAAIVVITCIEMSRKFRRSRAFKRLPIHYRTSLSFLSALHWSLALFSSVALMLPTSHDFSQAVQKTFFAFIMFIFLQLSLSTEGGERGLLVDRQDKVLNLGAPPFCCFPCLKTTKRPLTKPGIRLIRGLLGQMTIFQFFFFYVIISLKTAGELGSKSDTVLSVLQAVSWIAGIWGMGMLKDVVGNDLDKANFDIKRKTLQGMANILLLQNFIVVKIVDRTVGAYPCLSPHISPSTVAALVDSSLILMWCLIFCVIDHWILFTALSRSSRGEDKGDKLEENNEDRNEENKEDRIVEDKEEIISEQQLYLMKSTDIT